MGFGFKNPRVQTVRRLLTDRSARYESGRFVAEGPTLTAEAVRAGWTCVEQWLSEEHLEAAVDGAGELELLEPGVLERIASTRTPQAPLTVVEMAEHDPAAALADAGFVVVLHRIADPGNLGTILRSAEAAGADLVVLTPGGVDPYNPKVVRSSAGSLFHVPVVVAEPEQVAHAGLRLIGTSSHDAPGRTVETHTEADLTGRVAIVMGNEAAGLPDGWTDADGPIDEWVTIPHRGRSESLNVAMATTVLVFEAARQRDGQSIS